MLIDPEVIDERILSELGYKAGVIIPVRGGIDQSVVILHRDSPHLAEEETLP